MKPGMPMPRDLFGEQPERPRQTEKAQLIDVELLREPGLDTDHAYAVRKTWQHDPVWLPRKLTELHGSVFTFPRWLAIDRGLL